MRAEELASELASEGRAIQGHRIVAPVPTPATRNVATLIHGTPYRLRLPALSPGWYELEVVAEDRAEPTERGEVVPPYRLIQYRRQLDAIRVIAVHRVREHNWLVLPWNNSDARQRGWPLTAPAGRRDRSGTLAGRAPGVPAPRPCYLTTYPVRPFDVCVARDFGGHLLFDTLDRRTPIWQSRTLLDLLRNQDWQGADEIEGFSPEMRAAFSIHHHHYREQRRIEAERRRAERRRTAQGRLAEALEYSGARMRSMTERGDGYEVTWEVDGEVHRATVRDDTFVDSAGLCLSGRDSDYDLSALVHVVQNRPGSM